MKIFELRRGEEPGELVGFYSRLEVAKQLCPSVVKWDKLVIYDGVTWVWEGYYEDANEPEFTITKHLLDHDLILNL